MGDLAPEMTQGKLWRTFPITALGLTLMNPHALWIQLILWKRHATPTFSRRVKNQMRVNIKSLVTKRFGWKTLVVVQWPGVAAWACGGCRQGDRCYSQSWWMSMWLCLPARATNTWCSTVGEGSAAKEKGTNAQYKSWAVGKLVPVWGDTHLVLILKCRGVFQRKVILMPSPLCLNWRPDGLTPVRSQSSVGCMLLSCPTPPSKAVLTSKGEPKGVQGKALWRWQDLCILKHVWCPWQNYWHLAFLHMQTSVLLVAMLPIPSWCVRVCPAPLLGRARVDGQGIVWLSRSSPDNGSSWREKTWCHEHVRSQQWLLMAAVNGLCCAAGGWAEPSIATTTAWSYQQTWTLLFCSMETSRRAQRHSGVETKAALTCFVLCVGKSQLLWHGHSQAWCSGGFHKPGGFCSELHLGVFLMCQV